MTNKNYALIKSEIVDNVIVFDDSNLELLEEFKSLHNADNIILATEKTVIGGTYDGQQFWLPQPFPSWVKNEDSNNWEAPIPYPEDGLVYDWDENALQWVHNG
jgi:hypothetical protein